MTPRLAVRALSRVIVLVFIISFFVNALSMVLPLYTMQVFDRVLSARSEQTLYALTAVALFLVLTSGILEGARSQMMLGIDRWLDRTLFAQIVETRIERAASGRLTGGSAGLGDLRNLRAFFAGPSVLGVLDTAWAPFFLLVGFLIHPILGAIGTFGALGLLSLSVVNEFLMRDPQKQANLLGMKVSEQTESAVRSAEVVAALGMTPHLVDRIQETAGLARAKGDLANSRATQLSTITKVFRVFIQLAIMGVGVWLVLNEHMTAGAVFAASMIMGRGLAPFEQMQRTWTTIVSARQSYARLQEWLSDEDSQRSSMTFPPPKGALMVENLSFAPGPDKKPILNAITFGVKPGQVVGVIGPSASGKSTLARLLVGVWHPSSGNIRLDGVDVGTWNRLDFGQHIGYVPQDVELVSGTVRQNIARFGQASDDDVIAAAKAASAHDLILRLPKGYDTDIGEHGMLLSGGQRQRLALARALFGNPYFIVLDEPNSNLDTEGEASLAQALELARQRGAIVIIIAHRPNVLSFVDKLLVLKDGKVEIYGPRQHVLSKLQTRPKVVPLAAPSAPAHAAEQNVG